jgi:hypothetical protein
MTEYEVGRWYGWNGGECPVHPNTIVDVTTAATGECQRKAGSFDWSNESSNPIRSFFVVTPYVEPSKPKKPREFYIVAFKDVGSIAYTLPISRPPSCINVFGNQEIIHVREVLP